LTHASGDPFTSYHERGSAFPPSRTQLGTCLHSTGCLKPCPSFFESIFLAYPPSPSSSSSSSSARPILIPSSASIVLFSSRRSHIIILHRYDIISPIRLTSDTPEPSRLHDFIAEASAQQSFPSSLPSSLPEQSVWPASSTIMNCFSDFCLACDKQTNGTAYCSQICRLLETGPPSEPASPLYTDSKSVQRRSTGPIPTRIELPPAIDFSLYRQSSSTTSSARSSMHMPSLSRSPSQTSLTSTETSQSLYDNRLSEQVRKDLNSYAGFFDQTRTIRRRKSLQ
jgi:hypothetical protein